MRWTKKHNTYGTRNGISKNYWTNSNFIECFSEPENGVPKNGVPEIGHAKSPLHINYIINQIEAERRLIKQTNKTNKKRAAEYLKKLKDEPESKHTENTQNNTLS